MIEQVVAFTGLSEPNLNTFANATVKLQCQPARTVYCMGAAVSPAFRLVENSNSNPHAYQNCSARVSSLQQLPTYQLTSQYWLV